MKTLQLTDEEAEIIITHLISGRASASDDDFPFSPSEEALIKRVLSELGWSDE